MAAALQQPILEDLIAPLASVTELSDMYHRTPQCCAEYVRLMRCVDVTSTSEQCQHAWDALHACTLHYHRRDNNPS